MHLEVLPLAITMMAGPQILTALILTTSKRPIPNSLAFVAAVALTATVGVFLYLVIGNALGSAIELRDESGPTTFAKWIQILLVGVLVWLALRSYRDRDTATLPKWMGSLIDATPKRAFLFGAALIFLMPTDIVAMLTVGVNLASNNLEVADALPFLLLTTTVAALPLLAYLLFYRRAQTLMPKIRDWMSHNSWLVNIFVYVLFIYLIL
jgi:hypothetical protein